MQDLGTDPLITRRRFLPCAFEVFWLVYEAMLLMPIGGADAPKYVEVTLIPCNILAPFLFP